MRAVSSLSHGLQRAQNGPNLRDRTFQTSLDYPLNRVRKQLQAAVVLRDHEQIGTLLCNHVKEVHACWQVRVSADEKSQPVEGHELPRVGEELPNHLADHLRD